MTRWTLCVDESGNFADPHQAVVVAGVLYREDVAGLGRGDLTASIRKLAPYLPWPFHDAHVVQAVHHAFAAVTHAARTGAQAGPPLDPALVATATEVVLHLGDVDGQGTAEALTHYANRQSPPIKKVLALEAALQENTALHAKMRAYPRKVAASLHRFTCAIGGLRRGAPARPVVHHFACGETSSPSRVSAERRYLDALSVLLERVFDTLGRWDQKASLHLQISNRDIELEYARNGTQDEDLRRRPLTMADLGDALRRAERRWSPSVTVGQVAVPKYWMEPHPGVVLVDWMAGWAREVLASRRDPLTACETKLTTRFETTVASGDPALPHLSASGEAARLVRERRLPSDPPAGSVRIWALDQAMEWVNHGG